MRRLLFLLIGLTVFFRSFSQGDCVNAAPFCTGTAYSFPASTNTTSQSGPDYGCLATQPNPAWYYLQVGTSGQIIIDMNSSASVDIDFICWGPFTSPTGPCTAGLTAAATVDCSYSTAAAETCTIPNALVGQYYMLLITNYSNQVTDINFSQSNTGTGAGSTNCNILCSITSMNANAGACNPANNTFNISGTINTYAPPTSGTLTITSSCGGSTVINSPFNATMNYTIAAVPAGGGTCTVTAAYSADATCTFTATVAAPAPCNPSSCSITALSANPGACNPASSTFNVTGSVTFANPPSGGSLTVSSSCGGSQIVNAPFTSPTSYTLASLPANGSTCTVTAVFSADGTCTNTTTFIAPPACSSCAATAGNNGPICAGQTLNLLSSPNGGATYSWTGPNSFSSSLQNPSIVTTTSASAGVYSVTITMPGGSVCNATTTVTINPGPAVDAGLPATICTGGSVQLNASGGTSYSWSPAAGLSNASIANPVASPTATTSYTVTVGTGSGCSGTDVVTVSVVTQLNANAGADLTICQGQNAQLNGSGGTVYQWTPATGLSSAAISNPVASPSVTTSYSLVVSASGGCPNDTDVVVVTVNPSFSITVSANDTVCSGEAGTVFAGGANSYLWLPGGSTNDTLTIAPVASQTYSVIGTSGLCSDTQQVAIIVAPVSNANFSNSDQGELGDYTVTFTNSSANAVAYLWDFGDGDTSSASDPAHLYAGTGTYTVCLTAYNNFMCADTYCSEVELKPDWTVYIPNTFTPNEDGLNDVFYVYGTSIEKFELFIFDRWGNTIYHSTEMSEGWNGKVNNKAVDYVQIDTYVYRVKLTDVVGKVHKYIGHVNVVK
jgi:gliding motility-associated-like protein